MKRRSESLWESAWGRVHLDRADKGYLQHPLDASGWGAETSEPALDIWEHAVEVVVEAEVPGVSRSSLSIFLAGDTLVIEGHKDRPDVSDCCQFHRLERGFGYFRRVLLLPGTVDRSRAAAVLQDGLLVVRLPKMADRRKERVTIPISGC